MDNFIPGAIVGAVLSMLFTLWMHDKLEQSGTHALYHCTENASVCERKILIKGLEQCEGASQLGSSPDRPKQFCVPFTYFGKLK
jgi:hypothetical protein